MKPQVQVEEWLTETLHRELYEGVDIERRLEGISERIPASEEEAQDYIRTWLMELDTKSWISSIKVMNRLIDLWGFIVHYQSEDIEKPLESVAG